MRSIRTSLVVGAVLVMACAFALAGIAIYRGARSTLIADVDEELGEEIRLVASTVRTGGASIQLGFQDLDMPEYTSAQGDGYLELWRDDGSVLYRSPTLAGGELTALPAMVTDRTSFAWARTPDGRRVRAVSIRFDVERNEPHATPSPSHRGPLFVHAVAAVEPDEINGFLRRLKALLLAVGALAGLAAALTMAVVIRSSLRPLNDLAGQIERLRDDDLSSRVHVNPVPAEIEPVVGQLNQLLSRVESAFQRERNLSADIAHELRTPMADLRSAVEVVLSRPRAVDDYRETLESTLDPIRRVQAMVERLLYLGRLDAGQIEIEEQAVDMCELVKASWQPLAETAQRRRLKVDWELPQAASIVTDPLLLEIAIRNVLENATLYANEGGYVRIDIDEKDGRTTLRTINSGSKVAPEDVNTLLRRFARGDVSRTATGEHFGLGLALAAKIAAALHGSMDVQSRLGGEFSVTLSFQSEREQAVI
jgi:two-component system, OmpR family, heavy metal sensor histidine kinase CusS